MRPVSIEGTRPFMADIPQDFPRQAPRAFSAIGSLKSTRAVDKLHALVEAGMISDEDRGTWKKLRDIAAHGSFKVNPTEIQKLYDDVWRLNTLVYKLAFLRIGYSGKFSNRAVRDWPVQDFPPLAAAGPSVSPEQSA